MHLKAIYLLFATMCFIHHYNANSYEEVHDLMDLIRQKVLNLESEGKIKRNYEKYVEPPLTNEETYDFIIVGAGSSGSALVHRLSEISQWKILLLEAGGEPDVISEIPHWSPLVITTNQNWNFSVEKEDNLFLGFENERMYWPRGKVLGGSSVLNFMMYSRCAAEDFNRWEKMGNPGWSYRNVLKYFKKLETCKVEKTDEDVRGDEGPISVEEAYRSKLADDFIEAARKVGHRYVDYNGRNIKGVSHIQATLKSGLRCSGESCYIRPVKDRSNLTIRLNAYVTKILIENKIATGVEFEKDGQIFRALASKEVILSAGAIKSPHLLLLSGIGPKDQLIKFGIEPIDDLPVGRKIYDHQLFWGLGFSLGNPPFVYNESYALESERFEELYNEGRGILSSPLSLDGVAFVRTKIAPDDLPDIEIMSIPVHFCQDSGKGFRLIKRISKKALDPLCKSDKDEMLISSPLSLLHPKSFGYLELASKSPYIQPRIFSKYFSDPQGNDMNTMIAGVKEAIKIFLSGPFYKYDIKLLDRPIGGCENHEFGSDSYWECAIRHLGTTVFHHSTTCKMGPGNDPEAVVDNRLRVYGVKKLRVVDASVIPLQLTGHINVPAYLVGEKAADIIKEEHLI